MDAPGDLNFRIPIVGPFDIVLGEIHACLRAGLPYAAIHLALSVPDVCSALETDPESQERWKGTEKRYVAWCQRYLSKRFSTFDAADCWALRGGVLHNGNLTGHSKTKYDHVMFGLSSNIRIAELLSTNNGGTNLSGLAMDAGIFCDRVVEAAKEWIAERGTDPIVTANMENLVRLRPEGRAPHVVGLPVIS